MRTAQIAQDASLQTGGRAGGEALSTVARMRMRGREYTLCMPGPAQPPGGKRWHSADSAGVPVPLLVPDPVHGDRALACDGQLITVPAARYDWIHLLLSGPLDAEEEVWLHYRDATDPEWLRAGPSVGTHIVRLPVTRPEPLVALRLPEASGLQVLAATFVGPALAAGGRESEAVPVGESSVDVAN